MTNETINIHLNQVATLLKKEIETEKNQDRMCELQDAMEYMRRAWHRLDGIHCEDNQTTIEMINAMNRGNQ